MSDNNETMWERDNRVGREIDAYNQAAWASWHGTAQTDGYARQDDSMRELDRHNAYLASQSDAQYTRPYSSTTVSPLILELMKAGGLLFLLSIVTERFAYTLNGSFAALFRLAGMQLPTIIAEWVFYSARLMPVLFAANMLLRWCIHLFKPNDRTQQRGFLRIVLRFIFEVGVIAIISAMIIGSLLLLHRIGFIRELS